MNEIVKKVRAFAQENELFAPGQRLCAAVSGGADSMALLRLLLLVQPVFGYELTACHVNHGLRGAARRPGRILCPRRMRPAERAAARIPSG